MIDVHHIEQISQDCSLTEFVGTTVLDTIASFPYTTLPPVAMTE